MNLKEKYLGSERLSLDELERLKEDFIIEIANEMWIPTIEEMKKNYDAKIETLPETIKEKDLRSFGIRFTHHTNKMEGSSLTLRDVKLIIEDGIVPKDKPTDEVIETKSHISVYEDMIKCTEEPSMELLLKWHEKLFSLTKPDIAGHIRQYQIVIAGSNHTPPPGGIIVEEMLKDLFEWYEIIKDTMHPVVVACLMHFYFISIHPFGDGNGRITRLMTNYLLFKTKYPMFDIDPKIRQGYYRALEDGNTKNDSSIFISWFFKRYIDANKIYIQNKQKVS